MRIIGISGKKRTGKTTVAELIKAQLTPSHVEVMGFADALKREISMAILSIDLQSCNKDAKNRITPAFIDTHKDNFRLILQGWGTDFRRRLDGEDYWIKKLMRQIVDLPSMVDTVIIPDVRFWNEAQFVKDNGGLVFRVERDMPYTDNHASETDLDNYPFDFTINNNRDLKALEVIVKAVIENYLTI